MKQNQHETTTTNHCNNSCNLWQANSGQQIMFVFFYQKCEVLNFYGHTS